MQSTILRHERKTRERKRETAIRYVLILLDVLSNVHGTHDIKKISVTLKRFYRHYPLGNEKA